MKQKSDGGDSTSSRDTHLAVHEKSLFDVADSADGGAEHAMLNTATPTTTVLSSSPSSFAERRAFHSLEDVPHPFTPPSHASAADLRALPPTLLVLPERSNLLDASSTPPRGQPGDHDDATDDGYCSCSERTTPRLLAVESTGSQHSTPLSAMDEGEWHAGAQHHRDCHRHYETHVHDQVGSSIRSVASPRFACRAFSCSSHEEALPGGGGGKPATLPSHTSTWQLRMPTSQRSARGHEWNADMATASDDPLSMSASLHRQRTSQLSMELSSSSSAVGGHHVTLTQGATFLKQSCSRREEQFYFAVQSAQEALVDVAVRHTPQTLRAWREMHSAQSLTPLHVETKEVDEGEGDRWVRGYHKLWRHDEAAAEAALFDKPALPYLTTHTKAQPTSPRWGSEKGEQLLSQSTEGRNGSEQAQWLLTPVCVPSAARIWTDVSEARVGDVGESKSGVPGSPKDSDRDLQPHIDPSTAAPNEDLSAQEQCMVRLAASLWWAVPRLHLHTRPCAATEEATFSPPMVPVYAPPSPAPAEDADVGMAAGEATQVFTSTTFLAMSSHTTPTSIGVDASSGRTTAATSDARSPGCSTATEGDPAPCLVTAPPTPLLALPRGSTTSRLVRDASLGTSMGCRSHSTSSHHMAKTDEKSGSPPPPPPQEQQEQQVPCPLTAAEMAEKETTALALLAPFVPRFFGLRHIPLHVVNRAAATSAAASHVVFGSTGVPLPPLTSAEISKDTQAAAGASGAATAMARARRPSDADAYDEEEDMPAATSTEGGAGASAPTHRTAAHALCSPVDLPTVLPSPRDVTVRMVSLEDVSSGFVRPCVLDAKMGRRQYGLHPTDAKRKSKEKKAILSTSAQYGIRLAGFKRWDVAAQDYVHKTKLQCRALRFDEVRADVKNFMQHDPALEHAFRLQVEHLKRVFSLQSAYRFYTSSLLFVYDAECPVTTARVVMIDFAYTYRHAELVREGDVDAKQILDEGYLCGLRSLLTMLS